MLAIRLIEPSKWSQPVCPVNTILRTIPRSSLADHQAGAPIAINPRLILQFCHCLPTGFLLCGACVGRAFSLSSCLLPGRSVTFSQLSDQPTWKGQSARQGIPCLFRWTEAQLAGGCDLKPAIILEFTGEQGRRPFSPLIPTSVNAWSHCVVSAPSWSPRRAAPPGGSPAQHRHQALCHRPFAARRSD